MSILVQLPLQPRRMFRFALISAVLFSLFICQTQRSRGWATREAHDDGKICLKDADDQFVVVELNRSNGTFLIATKGDWAHYATVSKLHYRLPNGDKWTAEQVSNNLFLHTPDPNTPGDAHRDNKIEYLSWDNQAWYAVLHVSAGTPVPGPPLIFRAGHWFHHTPINSDRPETDIPGNAHCVSKPQ
jgi:hypothetical protein